MRDIDVRTAMRLQLTREHSGNDETLIVEEMGVWANSVRIDIAVINGELAGVELKSDRDTLVRLPLQSDIYSRVFDRLTLVAGSRHIEKASAIVPTWWSLIEARQNGSDVDLTLLRRGETNPSVDPFLVAHLLRKDEALEVLDSHGLAKGWRGKRIGEIHRRLADALPLKDLRKHVREGLRARSDWLRQNRTNQLNVAVDRKTDPKAKPLCAMSPVGDLVDDVISPTVSQTAAS